MGNEYLNLRHGKNVVMPERNEINNRNLNFKRQARLLGMEQKIIGNENGVL